MLPKIRRTFGSRHVALCKCPSAMGQPFQRRLGDEPALAIWTLKEV
jgi:hypothetical protein